MVFIILAYTAVTFSHVKPVDAILTYHYQYTLTIFECLLFGLKNHGLLILLLPDVSPASSEDLAPGLLLGVY